MEIIGYCCALVIGVIMGLTGAGGAILTVPVLVYLLKLEPVTATAYSLFIVGVTALFGSAVNLKKGLVSVKTGLTYALPSLIGVFIARKFIIPAIPEIIFSDENLTITRGMLIMLLFSIIMLLSAISMLRKKVLSPKAVSLPVLFIRMFAAGIVVGMVGAGGGFLFVPLLILVAGLSMKNAAATSLFIIAINSLVGFTGDLGNIAMDWQFLAIFTSIAIAGVFGGIYFSRNINEQRLKTGFGALVLVMSIVIFVSELIV